MDCFQIGHVGVHVEIEEAKSKSRLCFPESRVGLKRSQVECVVLHLAHFELVIMSGSLACLCVDRIVRTSQVGDDPKAWKNVGDDVGMLRGKQGHGRSSPFTYREMVMAMVVLMVVITKGAR